jgi:hypothetical protein
MVRLELRPGDELLIVDNCWPPGPAPALEGVRTASAPEMASPAHARNVGAAASAADWLVFLDADTEPEPALLDRYFDPAPAERTAILAGGVEDRGEGGSLAARMAVATGAMRQDASLRNGFMPYAITANCAIRRAAFEEAGGFEARAQAGEDADLCWRLQRLGWGLEERPRALVRHRSRESLSELWRQRFRHGAGAGWLERRYPGAMPAWGLPALVRDSLQRLGAGAAARFRGDRDELALAATTVSAWWAFELGRRLASNEARVRQP